MILPILQKETKSHYFEDFYLHCICVDFHPSDNRKIPKISPMKMVTTFKHAQLFLNTCDKIGHFCAIFPRKFSKSWQVHMYAKRSLLEVWTFIYTSIYPPKLKYNSNLAIKLLLVWTISLILETGTIKKFHKFPRWRVIWFIMWQ